jgi:ectoine hydroxylase-related dioxygenase (phytanoyl-CoA dioxygenase family)
VSWPDDRRPEPHEIAYAEMKKGSLLLYTGSVFHGGGANSSGGDRIGLNITYALGWLRQEENQYLACPPEVARGLSPELRRLLGYAMGSYALGYYTPPLPPGEGPEVVSPEWIFDHSSVGAAFGDTQLLEAIAGQTAGR